MLAFAEDGLVDGLGLAGLGPADTEPAGAVDVPPVSVALAQPASTKAKAAAANPAFARVRGQR